METNKECELQLDKPFYDLPAAYYIDKYGYPNRNDPIYIKSSEYPVYFELPKELISSEYVEFGSAFLPMQYVKYRYPTIRITIRGKKYLAVHEIWQEGKYRMDDCFVVPDNGTFESDKDFKDTWIILNKEPRFCYLYSNLIRDLVKIIKNPYKKRYCAKCFKIVYSDDQIENGIKCSVCGYDKAVICSRCVKNEKEEKYHYCSSCGMSL